MLRKLAIKILSLRKKYTNYLKSVDDLKYTKTTTSGASNTNELLTVKLRYKKPNEAKSKELKAVVENVLTSKLSSDFKFTAAVALFGMQLKDSEFVCVGVLLQHRRAAKTGF